MVKRVHLPDGLVDDVHDSLEESEPLEDAWTEVSAQEPPPEKQRHNSNGHAKLETPAKERTPYKFTRIDAGDDVLLR